MNMFFPIIDIIIYKCLYNKSIQNNKKERNMEMKRVFEVLEFGLIIAGGASVGFGILSLINEDSSIKNSLAKLFAGLLLIAVGIALYVFAPNLLRT